MLFNVSQAEMLVRAGLRDIKKHKIDQFKHYSYTIALKQNKITLFLNHHLRRKNMKKLLLIVTFFTQLITATNSEELENAIIESDKEKVQQLLQNNLQIKETEVSRLIDLAQQIILKRKSNQECYSLQLYKDEAIPKDFKHNNKEKKIIVQGFLSLAVGFLSLVTSAISATITTDAQEENPVPGIFGAIAFASFFISLLSLTNPYENLAEKYEAKLQKLLDDSIYIRSIIWKYHNSLQKS